MQDSQFELSGSPMTRIGFAYNMKPRAAGSALASDPTVATSDAALSPSTRQTTSQSNEARPEIQGGIAAFEVDDEFAEWDSPETIDAIADALAPLGHVIRLNATDDFPARVLEAHPDLVFNIAEGQRGPNREAHVPAILEFLGIPYSGSDPFTLSLCLDKSRTKETLSYFGIPTAPFARVTEIAQLEPFARRSFPTFVKPVHEGSSKGITERSICGNYEELREQTAFLLERRHEARV